MARSVPLARLQLPGVRDRSSRRPERPGLGPRGFSQRHRSQALHEQPRPPAPLRAVDELYACCRVGDDTWAALAAMYDTSQLLEFLLLVGNYRTLSYVQNSVGIRPVTGTTPNIPGNRFLFTEG